MRLLGLLAALVVVVPATAAPLPARLVVTGSVTPAAGATVGSTVDYVYTVWNTGGRPVEVTFGDALPTQVIPIEADPTHGSCSTQQQLVCWLGTVAPGQTVTVTIATQVARAGTFVNNVRIDPSDPSVPASVAGPIAVTATAAAPVSFPTATNGGRLALPLKPSAKPGLLLGVTEDQLHWSTHPRTLQNALAQLGLGAVHYTQQWTPGRARISSADAANLAQGIANARGLRVVLSVYGSAAAAPQTDAQRAQYCAYTRSIVQRFPQIHDVVIWNEANSSRFWQPQFASDGSARSPAQYEALLAACYGTLQTARPGVNVITSVAPRGNDDPRAKDVVGIPPATFVRDLGAAYQATGRPVKIFDTFGQNAYGLTSAERPWRTHPNAADLSEGDYPRLIAALTAAFAGTGQPLPGTGGMTVWYLEDGFQTQVPAAKASAYTGVENDRYALPARAARVETGTPAADSRAPDQATQLADAIKLAYCQPGVGAFFNFLLADESNLSGWQSGVLWADGTPKPSFAALADVVARAKAHTIDCATLKGGTSGGA